VASPWGTLLGERVQDAANGAGDVGDMTLEECRMFLLALARQERFADGAVDGAIRSGFVGVVLRRAQQLVQG
jgi:polyhydroxyalkanoate synthesis regulator phasin